MPEDELRPSLATTVSVASSFREAVAGGRRTRVPIVVTAYGFHVDSFAPRDSQPQDPFTVLAVGSHDLRKGTPYLLEAWKRAAIPDAELHLVGPLRLAKSFLDDYAGMFRHWPHVPKSELPAHYAAADLCAFPTLGDGFGLVIQESMCCGTRPSSPPLAGWSRMHHGRDRRLDHCRRGTSTRWSGGSVTPPPIASVCSQWGGPPGHRAGAEPGVMRVPRSSALFRSERRPSGGLRATVCVPCHSRPETSRRRLKTTLIRLRDSGRRARRIRRSLRHA